MNPEVKTEWVKRLREPERKQIKRLLEVDGEGQCCLGVLCEIAAEEGVVIRNSGGKGHDVFYGESRHTLPTEVIKWSGLTNGSGNPVVSHPEIEGTTSLANLNDSFGFDFPQIADVIEEEL